MNEQQVFAKLLEKHRTNSPILTSREIHPDVPTLHNFTDGYRSSVRHCGFGMFLGRTPSGEFSFDGGGAMCREATDDEPYFLNWTYLRASQEVLDDLGYDREAVAAALEEVAGL